MMECLDAKRTYRMGRREALQIGSGLFGLTLCDFLQSRQLQAAATGQPTNDLLAKTRPTPIADGNVIQELFA